MGCGSSQSGAIVSPETKENGLNEMTENGHKKYRKYSFFVYFSNRIK